MKFNAWGKNNKWWIEILIMVFGLGISVFVLVATWKAATSAADSAKSAQKSAEISEKSLRMMNDSIVIANTSTSISRESVHIMKENIITENRPYLFITCNSDASKDCNGRTGLTIVPDGECIEKLSFDFMNGGRTPAVIINSAYMIDFIIKNDGKKISIRKKFSEDEEQVNVFPDKPLHKLVTNFFVEGKPIDKLCNVESIEFTIDVDYSSWIARDKVFPYKLKTRVHWPDLKNPEILYEIGR